MKNSKTESIAFKISRICFLTYIFFWFSWILFTFGPGIPAWIEYLPDGLIHYTVLISNIGTLVFAIYILKRHW